MLRNVILGKTLELELRLTMQCWHEGSPRAPKAVTKVEMPFQTITLIWALALGLVVLLVNLLHSLRAGVMPQTLPNRAVLRIRFPNPVRRQACPPREGLIRL